jgi:hypothetical protein
MIMTKWWRRMEQSMLRSCTCLAIFGASRSAELLQGKALLRSWSWRYNLDIAISIYSYVVHWGQTRKIGSRSYSNDLGNSDACWYWWFGHEEWNLGFFIHLRETLKWEIFANDLNMIDGLDAEYLCQIMWSELGTIGWLAPSSLSADSGFCHSDV